MKKETENYLRKLVKEELLKEHGDNKHTYIDKKKLWPEFENVFEQLDESKILSSLFDYFNIDQLDGYLSHIKEEFGISNSESETWNW